MKGNFHVRFLEEGERATVLLYSAIARIFTDLRVSASSAQSVSYRCSSGASAFICVHLRLIFDRKMNEALAVV